jgi:hypothetical protein
MANKIALKIDNKTQFEISIKFGIIKFNMFEKFLELTLNCSFIIGFGIAD